MNTFVGTYRHIVIFFILNTKLIYYSRNDVTIFQADQEIYANLSSKSFLKNNISIIKFKHNFVIYL